MKHRRGFTLVELMVVMLIILMIAIVAIPALLDGWRTSGLRQTAANAQSTLNMVQSIVPNAPNKKAGVRLLPDPELMPARLSDGRLDPTQPIAYNRMVALTFPTDYAEGLVNVQPTLGYTADLIQWASDNGVPLYNRLMVEQAVFDGIPKDQSPQGTANNPTSWFWNIRLGEKIMLGGRPYTVCGPMLQWNPDGFVNVGPYGTISPLGRLYGASTDLWPTEFLLVVNGVDDNHDGFIDSGWDGIDNDLDSNPGDPVVGVSKGVDEEDESEPETWLGLVVDGLKNSRYSISRMPYEDKRLSYELPSGFAIDGTGYSYMASYHNEASWTDNSGVARTSPGWDYSYIRSRMPVNPYLGTVDIIFDVNGINTTGPYQNGLPAPLSDRFYHLWIADVKDITSPPPTTGEGYLVTLDRKMGKIVTGYADQAEVQKSLLSLEQ